MIEKVKVYTTPSCHSCRQAKEFLAERGVAFDAVDVSENQEALREMREISGGARSAPVIAVGDKVILGFVRGDLEEALKSLK